MSTLPPPLTNCFHVAYSFLSPTDQLSSQPTIQKDQGQELEYSEDHETKVKYHSNTEGKPSKRSTHTSFTTPKSTPKRWSSHHLSAFLQMSLPYFRFNKGARWRLLLIAVLLLFKSCSRIVFSFLARDFWTALSELEVDNFYFILNKFLVALLLLAPIDVYYRFQKELLGIYWREWFTQSLLKQYYDHRVYYNIEHDYHQQNFTTKTTSLQNIDNPDQRITEDVRSFTGYSLVFTLTIISAIIDLISFSIILFMIRPQLFISIIIFATFSTVITIVIGKKLVSLNYEKQQLEADLRYGLVRTRDNAESIAFYKGEKREQNEIDHRLSMAIQNMKDINIIQRNLDFFTTCYYYLIWILPLVVVAPQYFAGNIDLGVVTQASSSFGHVLNDLSLIVDNFESLSQFAAGIDRLYHFISVMKNLSYDNHDTNDTYGDTTNFFSSIQRSAPSPPNSASETNTHNLNDFADLEKSQALSTGNNNKPCMIDLEKKQPIEKLKNDSNSESETAMSIENLTLLTPDYKRILISNLNLSLNWGDLLLITGMSGSGKSSLLRCISGLWRSGVGKVVRPNDEDTFFLPQQPYCCLGTLRDQLLYPQHQSFHTSYNDNDTMNYDASGEGRYYSIDHVVSSNKMTGNIEKRTCRNMIDDKTLLQILKIVKLDGLIKRYGHHSHSENNYTSTGENQELMATELDDTIIDWGKNLSLGEQQKIGFARILIHQPSFIILDESTSALDVETEKLMYHLVTTTSTALFESPSKTTHRPQQPKTIISVGHRPTLNAYHNRKIHLDAENRSFSIVEFPMTSDA